MAKLLRINLSALSATTEEVPEAYRKFGGRGLTACILDREVPPTCDPLGAENKLIWAPGLMGGTTAPCSGRICVGTAAADLSTLRRARNRPVRAPIVRKTVAPTMAVDVGMDLSRRNRIVLTEATISTNHGSEMWAGEEPAHFFLHESVARAPLPLRSGQALARVAVSTTFTIAPCRFSSQPGKPPVKCTARN